MGDVKLAKSSQMQHYIMKVNVAKYEKKINNEICVQPTRCYRPPQH